MLELTSVKAVVCDIMESAGSEGRRNPHENAESFPSQLEIVIIDVAMISCIHRVRIICKIPRPQPKRTCN